jgi:tetratricopeptide (TPR) repeat protein
MPKPTPDPKLQPPDTHHLRAASGWLELGNAEEAGNEIGRISAACLEHPDVLEIRWAICAAGATWEAALDIARKLVASAPERASGWIHRAYCLRRVAQGGLSPAWDALRPAYEKFPQEPIIPYNLACYSAQFGNLDDAWDWLNKAAQAAGRVQPIRSMALTDADLEPLRERIRQWSD